MLLKYNPIKVLLELIFHRKELKYLRVQEAVLKGVIEKLKKGDKIALDDFERKMIVDALVHPGYVAKVRDPAAKRFIRQVYIRLKEKMVLSLREE